MGHKERKRERQGDNGELRIFPTAGSRITFALVTLCHDGENRMRVHQPSISDRRNKSDNMFAKTDFND